MMVSRLWTLFRHERGDALPFALVALAVGTLLISPLMAKVSSSFQVSIAAESALKRHYAADAAAEMAVWKLTGDETFREQLLAAPGSPLSVPMMAMNAISPTIEVVSVSALYTTTGQLGDQYLPWVVWANSQSANHTFDVSGAGHHIIGGAHTNNELKVSGAGHVFQGPVEWVGSKQVTGAGHSFTPPLSSSPAAYAGYPISWNIAAFRPGGAEAIAAAGEAKYWEHFDRYQVSGAGVVVPPGLHYCHGDAHISGAGVVGTNVTIVAEGVIDISGAGMSFSPYIAGLTFFSAKSSSQNVISISGAGNTGGTSYAPDGKISLTGSGGQIIGAFLGNVVNVSGAGATLSLAQVAMVAPEPELLEAIYDIRVTAADGELTARVKQEQVAYSSWSVRNPNAAPVAYTWEIVGAGQSGLGAASSGVHTLTTDSVQGTEQARITWVDQLGVTQMAVADITLVAGDPPGTASNLVLTSMCSPDPATQRVWRIRNPNTFVMTANWDVYGTAQAGTVLAPPGDSYFTTVTVEGANTTRLHWLDHTGTYRETVKASGTTQCEGEAPVWALTLVSGGRSDASTPTFTVQSWDLH